MSEDFLERPILIVGPMRSGTTLVGRILNSHPDVFIRYLQTNFLRFVGVYYNSITKEVNVVKLIEKIKNHTIKNNGQFSSQQEKSILQYLERNGCSLRNVYNALALFLFNTAKQRWGEKYAGDCREVEYFFEIFPKGQIIYINRDIRAVYASNKQ